MPLSQDPEARRRQLANLLPAGEAHLQHGARSEPIVRELSIGFLAELEREFPDETDYWRKLQARRLAKIEARTRYLEGRPSEVMNQKIGRVNPATVEEENLTKAALADFDRAEQRKRDREAGGRGGLAALRQHGEQIGDARAN
jgi:hypothetical protein